MNKTTTAAKMTRLENARAKVIEIQNKMFRAISNRRITNKQFAAIEAEHDSALAERRAAAADLA